MLVDFNVHLKLKCLNRGKTCLYYMLSSHCVKLHYLMGRLSNYHGWEIGESDLKGFKGSLAGVMQELYAEREKKYVSSICFFI